MVPRGGETASLHCPAGSSNIDWAKVVSGTVEDLSSAVIDRIVVDCALQPNRSSLYAVRLDSATGRCDLVIKNAEPSHAGIYLCYESDDVVTSAKFLVADPGNAMIFYNYDSASFRRAFDAHSTAYQRLSRSQ